MRQITLSGAGFDKYRKETRKERFLDNMEKIIPWKEPADALGPCYPNPKGAGRRRIGVERMLRIHFLQHGWFSLPDPAVGEDLHESPAMRRFVNIDPCGKHAPGETDICRFRHHMYPDPLRGEASWFPAYRVFRGRVPCDDCVSSQRSGSPCAT